VKIPTYESAGGIKVGNIPEISQESVRASEREQAGLSAAIKKVSVDFAEVEKARSDVRDFRQTNEASALTFDKLNAIKAVADEDIEFDPARYETEIDNLGQEASKTITNPLAKEKFMAEFQRQATTTKWGIKNLLRTKELEAAKASIEYNRQQIVNGYASMTPAEQITAVKTFKDMLIGSVATGIYNKDTANQIDLKFQQDVQESVVNTHILADPKSTLAGLKEGKDGPYSGISDQFRAESIVKAEAYDKKYTAEAEVAEKKRIDTNENDIVTRLIDPKKQKPTEGEIVTLMNNRDLTPKFAKAVINNIRSAKKVNAKTIDKDFADIISAINRGVKSPEKIKANIINLSSDGYLSEEDTDNAITYLGMMNTSNPDDLVAMNMRKSWLGVEVWSENVKAKEESRSRMSRSFINKLRLGMDAQPASVAAMREEVLYLHPEVIGKVEGAEYMDDRGKIKKIMPNGDIMEIQSTKKDTRTKESK
jgi:hypothetical protein